MWLSRWSNYLCARKVFSSQSTSNFELSDTTMTVYYISDLTLSVAIEYDRNTYYTYDTLGGTITCNGHLLGPRRLQMEGETHTYRPSETMYLHNQERRWRDSENRDNPIWNQRERGETRGKWALGSARSWYFYEQGGGEGVVGNALRYGASVVVVLSVLILRFFLVLDRLPLENLTAVSATSSTEWNPPYVMGQKERGWGGVTPHKWVYYSKRYIHFTVEASRGVTNSRQRTDITCSVLSFAVSVSWIPAVYPKNKQSELNESSNWVVFVLSISELRSLCT